MQKKWGTYPWFLEHGIDKIHPDDVDIFIKEANNCKMFECVKENSVFITLKYNERVYRVKKDLFNEVAAPRFAFGQKVKLVDESNQEVLITDIMWHYDKNEPYYLVKVDNKKKSRRYFEVDFEYE